MTMASAERHDTVFCARETSLYPHTVLRKGKAAHRYARQCGAGAGEGQPHDPEVSIALYRESEHASHQPPRAQGYQASMLLRVQRRSGKVFQSIMRRHLPCRASAAAGSLTALRSPVSN
jgi:hypothetical protein